MENIALAIAIIIAIVGIITSLLVLKKANQRNKKALNLENEYEYFNDTIAELQQQIDNIKSENESENLNDTIAELQQQINNIKNENKEYDRILKNYENNLSIISKIEKDNSDLLLFYREYIHKMAHINPINKSIGTFIKNSANIDETLDKKQKLDIMGEYLNAIDFSDRTKKLANYIKSFVDGLYDSFSNIDEKLPNINSGQNKIFYKEAIDCAIMIMETKEPEIEKIELYYKDLIKDYPKYKKIQTSSKAINTALNIASGLRIFLSQGTGCEPIANWLNKLRQDSKTEDEKFVKTYDSIFDKFMETSFTLERTLDVDFTAIEILYQNHKQKEYISLFKEIQNYLLSGKDINDLYSTWREAQFNEMIKDASNIEEYIFESLQAKKLNEDTISNIKEMVCQNPPQNTTPPNFILVPSVQQGE